MLTSRDRILTTHVGSLPRNETITELLIKREADGQVDPKKMADELDRAVAEVVKRQKDAGIDIGNDGEQQRVGVPDLHGAAHVRLRRREQAPRRQGLRRASRSGRELRPALRAPRQDFQRPAGDRRREIHRHRSDQGRDRALQEIRVECLRRAVHDCAVARHRGDHADECALRLARGLRERARGAASQGVSRNPRGRTDPAGRRAGSRDGTRDDISRTRPTRASSRSPRCISRRSTRPARAFRPTAGGCTSAGATGKARTSTTSRSPRCCRCSTRRPRVRFRSSSPTRAISTNTRRSRRIRSRRTRS